MLHGLTTLQKLRVVIPNTLKDSNGNTYGTEIVSPDGKTSTVKYQDGSTETRNESGQKTSSTATDGTTTNYNPDTGQPTSRTYPDGGTVQFDGNGNPTTYTPPGGTPTPIPPGGKVC